MNGMDDLTRDALKGLWDLAIDSLDCLNEEEGRRRYKARTANAAFFVKVQRHQGDSVDDLERGFCLQAYLHKNGFPTNRICPSRQGSIVERLDGYGIAVEPWIECRPFEKDLESWHVFGELAGQLHSFPRPEELAWCVSRMDPNRTLDGVLQQIDERRKAVPQEYLAKFSSFRSAANAFRGLESVPRTLIHSDLAWCNVMRTVDGQFMLVDFEGGGIGPPVVDLVEVTTQVCRGKPDPISLDTDLR